MELQSYIKSLAVCVLNDEEYVQMFSIIRDPKANEGLRGAAAMRVACSCYLQIVKLVFGFRSAGIDLVELLSFGFQAMAEICLKSHSYDPANGHIMPYAKLALKGALTEYVANNRPDAAPYCVKYNAAAQLRRVRGAMKTCHDKNGEWPSAEQILVQLRQNTDKMSQAMTLENVEKCLAIVRDGNVVELNAPVKKDGECTFAELIGQEDCPDERISADKLMVLLKAYELIDARKAIILKRSLGIGCAEQNLSTIAKSLGISREAVRQARNRALRDLRAMALIDAEAA